MRTFITGIILWMFCAVASGQNVTATASAPKVVKRGEQFSVQFQINAKPDGAKIPDITDFVVLGGPSSASSTNVSIVNGVVSQQFTATYTYYLQASKVGVFTISPATFTVKDKNYTSNGLKIEVIPGVVSGTSGGASGTSSGQVSPSGSPAPDEDPSQAQAPQSLQSASASDQPASSQQDMYLRLLLDKTTVYQGEPIAASIKLFSKTQISGIDKAVFPPFDGFYSHEVEFPPVEDLEREAIDGEIYGTAVLKKYTLFPQKSGEVVIPGPSLDATVPQRVQQSASSIWDDFFGPSLQYVNRKVTGPQRIVRVLPLPEGKPSSFTGGVGNFTFKVAVDKVAAKTNDAITFTATVTGSGNLRLIDAPAITFPPDFETYDPKTTVNADAADMTGTKTFEYLIIPRHSGTYTVPGVTFSYFDPKIKKYQTIVSEGFTFDIAKGEEQSGTITTVKGGVAREDVQFLGKDIRYIKTGDLRLVRNNGCFFGTLCFWLWYLVPASLFGLALWWRRRYIKMYADHTLRKHLRASKYASRRLKKAKENMEAGNREHFFEEVSRALWGYLSDKLNIPLSELSKDNAMNALRARHVPEEAVLDFVVLIDTAEFARYAPSVVGQDLRGVYERAVSTISRMQKELAK